MVIDEKLRYHMLPRLFSNRRAARDLNVSVHRPVLGAADDCTEVDVSACRVKSYRDAEPCSEWDGGSGCREVHGIGHRGFGCPGITLGKDRVADNHRYRQNKDRRSDFEKVFHERFLSVTGVTRSSEFQMSGNFQRS